MASWTPGNKVAGSAYFPFKESVKKIGKSWDPILEEPIVDAFPTVKRIKIGGFINVERDNKIVELDHYCRWISGPDVKKYVDLFNIIEDPDSIGGICNLCGKWKQKWRHAAETNMETTMETHGD